VSEEPVPSHLLPLATRAPGKCILFGEHAVVHGRPELLLAIDAETQLTVRPAKRSTLNGTPVESARNPYASRAMDALWSGQPPIAITSTSRLPRASGLGSWAAFVAARGAALGAATGGIDRPRLAAAAFRIEREAQGVGSPGDTSAAVGGGYLSLNGTGGSVAWKLEEGDRRWTVRRHPDPEWVWIVADSGIHHRTGDAVRAVGARLAAADGAELLDRFERVALSGMKALGAEDRSEVGRLLDENQELLRIVGVSHPRLEELLVAARPEIEGGKLTGAGAGGCVVVLPKPGREMAALRSLTRAGANAFAVRGSRTGAALLGELDPQGD
jgi:mevalonate kinase